MSHADEYYRRRLREEDFENQIKEEEFQRWCRQDANKKPGIEDWIIETNTRYYSSLILFFAVLACAAVYVPPVIDAVIRFFYGM